MTSYIGSYHHNTKVHYQMDYKRCIPDFASWIHVDFDELVKELRRDTVQNQPVLYQIV
jgi:hypothetical protein